MNEGEPAKVLLIAEDSEADILFLKRAFAEADATLPLVVVSDGKEALDYVLGRGSYTDRSKHPAPSLLLLDLKMPKVSGFEVLEGMKVQDIRQPKVVVLTSSEEAQDVRRAYELGACAYVVKPQSLGILKKIAGSLATMVRHPDWAADSLGWYVRPLP